MLLFTLVAAGAPHRYHVGQAVQYVDYGTWRKAVVIAVRNDAYAPYRVHPFGYIDTMDAWVPESYIRIGGTAEKVPGGEAADPVYQKYFGSKSAYRAMTTPGKTVAQKRYNCVSFVVDHLVGMGSLTIVGGSSYLDRDGHQGRYSRSGNLLTFHGAALDGQRARYDMGGYGRPSLHILGPSGRGVIDCD